jgi:hypothetical protein
MKTYSVNIYEMDYNEHTPYGEEDLKNSRGSITCYNKEQATNLAKLLNDFDSRWKAVVCVG